MKKNIFLGLALVLILFIPTVLMPMTIAQEPQYSSISVQQAQNMIKHTSDLLILDVRNQCDYNLGHLFDALFLPANEISQILANPIPETIEVNGTTIPFGNPDKVNDLQPYINEPILVYCKTGMTSSQACQILASNGFTNVYNMIGGITEWIQTGYSIYTTTHNVTVDFSDKGKPIVQIEPMLLTQSSTQCDQTQPCQIIDSVNTTTTILEDLGNRQVVNVTQEFNGTSTNCIIDKTILWDSTDTNGHLNRTITFSSEIWTQDDGPSEQVFVFKDVVQDRDYDLTIGTVIIPLSADTYNTSFTFIEYKPNSNKQITTFETVTFNSSATLSQIYYGLSKVADDLSNEYKKSEDPDLKQFAKRYDTIAKETKDLSKIMEKQLSQYNLPILKSGAVIEDGMLECVLCLVAVGAAQGAICAALAACSYGTAFYYCYQMYMLFGRAVASGICYSFFDCMGEPEPPSAYGTVYDYSTSGGASINYPYSAGGTSDSSCAVLYCLQQGSMAQIFLQMSTIDGVYPHGQVQVDCLSYSGYSELYVYVSTDGSNWNYVNAIGFTGGATYRDIGWVDDCFIYMLIVGYNADANGFIMGVDSVRASP